MAEAKITINFTPREFDLMRAVLDEEYRRMVDVATSAVKSETPGIKTAARRRSVELNDILSKLR